MKKYFGMLAIAACALTISSCSSDDETTRSNEPVKKTFIIGAPGTDGTRAVVAEGFINDEAPKVYWEKGDQVGVWGDGDNANAFTWQENLTYKNTAYFNGVVVESNKYYVMYPYQSGASKTSTAEAAYLNVTIPQVQYARKESFDPQAAICIGVSEPKPNEKEAITLLHACAFLKITVPKATKQIAISASSTENPNWKLAGKVQITANSAGASITSFLAGQKTVYLMPQSGSESIEKGTYLIAVASSTKFPGLEINVDYADDSKCGLETTKEIQFNAGCIYNLGTATDPSK